MKRHTVRAFALFASALLLLSGASPLFQFGPGAVGTAAAASSYTIENYEDGNIDIDHADWSGYGGNASVELSSSADALTGNYSAKITSNGSTNAPSANLSSSNPAPHDRVSMQLSAAQLSGDSADGIYVRLRNGSTKLVTVMFNGDGDITTKSGGTQTDTGQDWFADQQYNVEIANIDYGTGTYDLVVNGENLGNYNFVNSGTQVSKITIQLDNSNTGISRTIFTDEFRVNQTFQSNPSAIGVLDDFEDGSIATTNDNWDEWGGDTSFFSTESGSPISGSYSGNLTATDAVHSVNATAVNDFSPDNTTVTYRLSTDTQDGETNVGTDETQYILRKGTTQVIHIRFNETDNSIYSVKSGGTRVDTGLDWKPKTDYTIRLKNISWTNHEYDLVINDQNVGRYAFQNAKSNITNVWVRSDTRGSNETRHLYVDDLEFGIPHEGSGSSVSGRVVTHNGNPVTQATVEIVGSKKSTTSKARSHIDTVSDPTPTAWDEQVSGSFALFGSSGVLSNTSGRYAAIYQQDDLGAAWDDTATLSDPLWRNIPTNQQVSIIVGKQSECGFLSEIDEYNRQIPGCAATSGSLTIEKLSPTGGVVSSDTVDIAQQTEGGYAEPASVDYASYSFKSAGIYRISVKGTSFSYLVKAGSVNAILDKSLETINGQLTQFSQTLQSDLNDGVLVRKTVTTDSEGYYSVSLPSSVKVVSVSARKVSGVSTEISASEMRTGYNTGQYEGALYIPSSPKRVEVPAQNVDLTMTEVSWPPNGNLSKLQAQLDTLRNKLDEITSTTIVKKLPASTDATLDELRATYRELAGLIRANPTLQDAYLEFSDRRTVATAGDLSKSELNSEIAAMNQALAVTASTGDVAAENPTVDDSTVDQRWRLSGIDLEAANVSVIAHWSNGTSQTVPDTHLRTNADLATSGGVVRVVDFPLGSKQPAAVQFELTVAGQNGVVHGRAQVTNPSFDGTLPSIAAIELNTLHPGPADSVSMQVHPASDSSFRRVVDATVYAPDGTALSSTIENGDTVTYTTNGVGVHTAKLTLQTTGGHDVTQTVRVQAHDTDLPAKPSVRARASPLGVFAVVGDGFTGGDVDVNSESMVVTARVPDSGDAPNRIHVFTDSLSAGADTPTTVRVVKGEQDRSVSQHLYVTWHTKSLPSEAITWRGENGRFFSGTNEPITRTGSTRYGVVTTRANGTTINTYTKSDGSVIIDPEPTPNAFDRAEWTVETTTSGIDIPLLNVAPLAKVTA